MKYFDPFFWLSRKTISIIGIVSATSVLTFYYVDFHRTIFFDERIFNFIIFKSVILLPIFWILYFSANMKRKITSKHGLFIGSILLIIAILTFLFIKSDPLSYRTFITHDVRLEWEHRRRPIHLAQVAVALIMCLALWSILLRNTTSKI